MYMYLVCMETRLSSIMLFNVCVWIFNIQDIVICDTRIYEMYVSVNYLYVSVDDVRNVLVIYFSCRWISYIEDCNLIMLIYVHYISLSICNA